MLPLAGLEGSSTKTYSLAVVGLDAYRRYVPGEQRCRGSSRWAEISVSARGGTFGAELLTLSASVVAVNCKAHARGGRDLGFAVWRVYFAHAFVAASEDLVARRGSQVRLLSVPQAEGRSDVEELRELLW